jgi:hypothetical protein
MGLDFWHYGCQRIDTTRGNDAFETTTRAKWDAYGRLE